MPEAKIQGVDSRGVPFTGTFADLLTAVRERTAKDVDQFDARAEATLTARALGTKDLRSHAIRHRRRLAKPAEPHRRTAGPTEAAGWPLRQNGVIPRMH